MRKKSGGGKGVYRKSTPVIRLQRNVEKISRLIALCRDRLEVWRQSDNVDVDGAVGTVDEVVDSVRRLSEYVESLVAAKFVPPRRMMSWKPSKGDRVKVATDYRRKYEEAYALVLKTDPLMLDDLSVVEHLPSGEVLVQRGRRTPFLVRKSHLAKLPEEAT